MITIICFVVAAFLSGISCQSTSQCIQACQQYIQANLQPVCRKPSTGWNNVYPCLRERSLNILSIHLSEVYHPTPSDRDHVHSLLWKCSQHYFRSICQRCITTPPLTDTMCIHSCGNTHIIYFRSICQRCITTPPLTSAMCAYACGNTHIIHFRAICNRCWTIQDMHIIMDKLRMPHTCFTCYDMI